MGSLESTYPECARDGAGCLLLNAFVERQGLSPDQKDALVDRCREFNDRRTEPSVTAGSLCLEQNVKYENEDARVAGEAWQAEVLGVGNA